MADEPSAPEVVEADIVDPEVAEQACPNCGEPAPVEANWCEACGQDLQSEPRAACVACGEREVGPEGYCLSCGHKQPEERDHLIYQHGHAVAITDRGKRHRHNEDAVAIAALPDGGAVLVVCDGVSTTAGSAAVSLRAANAACDLLAAGVPSLENYPSDGDGMDALIVRAVAAAQAEAEVAAVDPDADQSASSAMTDGPPSSTLVAAVIVPLEDSVEVAVGWVGDSRAYWLPDLDAAAEAVRLTPRDHELGGSLVRWLGADTIDASPEIEHHSLTGPGIVVVCSDGLWRYAAEPGELNETVRRLVTTSEGETSDGMGIDGPALAEALVAFANEGGGHDNISVALWSNIAMATQG